MDFVGFGSNWICVNPFALDLSIIGCCWIEKLDNPIHIGSLISRTYGRTLAAGGGWLQSYVQWPCRQRTRPSGGARWRWWRSCCRARCVRRPCRAAGGDGGGAGALVGGAERAVPGSEVVLRSAESSRRSMARASKSAATVRRPHEYYLAGSRGRRGEPGCGCGREGRVMLVLLPV